MPAPFEFRALVLRHPEHRARFSSIHKRVIDPFVEPVGRILDPPGAPDLDPAQVALAVHPMKLDYRLHARLFLNALGIEEEWG